MKNSYFNVTDEELIQKFLDSDSEAFEEILNRYKPFVKKTARFLFLEGGDQEDLLQEGMIGLLKAVREYDPDKNASFAAFARVCVSNQMLSAIESASRKKHLMLNSSLSIDQLDERQLICAVGTARGPEAIFLEQESVRQVFEEINSKLSPMERNVLKLYLDGLDYIQISYRMNKPVKSIDNALQRIKNKIR